MDFKRQALIVIFYLTLVSVLFFAIGLPLLGVEGIINTIKDIVSVVVMLAFIALLVAIPNILVVVSKKIVDRIYDKE